MRFGPWFYRFFTRYFGWREFGIVTAVLVAYLFVFGASALNVALFWGLPAILSALQLFVFGTWLPHRHGVGQTATAGAGSSTRLARGGAARAGPAGAPRRSGG